MKASSSVTVSELVNHYKVVGHSKTETERTFDIEYQGNSTFYGNPSSSVVKRLKLSISFYAKHQLNFKIFDADNERWEVPHNNPFPFVDPSKRIPLAHGDCHIEVVHAPFAIKVTRKDNHEVIFDTTGADFIYSDLYIEFATAIPSSNLFGWGERAYKMNLGPNGNYTLWNKDLPGLIEDGSPGHNGYGFHPFYLAKSSKGNFNLVHLRNSNAMQVAVQGEIKQMTVQVTGGVLDFIVFLGDHNPETAVQRYHDYLGGWQMPPFWSLGWQQSKWGYHYLSNMTEIIGNYTELGLPLDVIWSDLDYMTEFIDFTVDEERFPHKDFRDLLERTGKKWVPIVDAGIAIGDNEGYRKGLEYDLFIKDWDGEYFTGIVWPGNVHFPDFFNPNATKYWTDMLAKMHDMVPFSGIWIDMNEVANFCDGDCVKNQVNGTGRFDNLPFTPSDPSLYNRTVSLSATHYGGENKTIFEYDVHPLFAFMEASATHDYLKTLSNLTFALSRSTFAGSGKYTNHWLGDVWTTWDFLQLALPGIMNMNMFGIPLVGSDICGFIGNTTEHLCTRWMQIGVLYPFARNHHENATNSQEPWVLGPTVLETSRQSLNLRYSILKFYYSQFVQRNGQGTIFRPLFFEFPDDENLYNHSKKITDEQILIGRGLMAAPALYDNISTVDVYFPKDDWFNFFTGEQMHDADEEGKTVTVDAPVNTTLPLFIRGGTVIQKQDVTGVLSSADLTNSFELVAAMNYHHKHESYVAKGFTLGLKNYTDEQAIWDRCVQNNCMLQIEVIAKNNHLKVRTKAAEGAQDLEKVVINKLSIYGLNIELSNKEIVAVRLNENEVSGFNKISESSDKLVIELDHHELGHNDEIHIELA